MTKIITGIITALTASETKKGNPRVDITLTQGDEAMTCTTFGDTATAITEMGEGAELTVAMSPSNGRYATQKDAYLISEIDPVMPTRDICYMGRDLEEGETIILSDGKGAGYQVLGAYTVAKTITAEMLRDLAYFDGEPQEQGIDEVLVMEGYLVPQVSAELNLNRTTVKGVELDFVSLDELAVEKVEDEEGEGETAAQTEETTQAEAVPA